MVRVAPIGAGARTEETSDRSDSLQVGLDVRTTTSPGRIVIRGEVDGKLGASFGDIASGFNRDTIKIRFLPFVGPRANEIRQEYRTILSEQLRVVKEVVPDLPGRFATNFSEVVPEGLRNIDPVSRQLWIGVFGQQVAGETPVDFTKRITFDPVTIPTISRDRIETARERFRDRANGLSSLFGGIDIERLEFPDRELPDIPVTIEVVPTGALQRTVSSGFGDLPSVTINIPASAFIQQEEVDIFDQLPDRVPCVERFSGIDRDISRLEERIPQRGELRSRITQGLSNAREKLSQRELSEIENEVSNLFGRVRNMPPDTPCADEFRSRLNSLLSNARGETVQLSCSDVNREVRNLVSGVEGDVQGFLRLSPRRRILQRRERLITDAQRVKSQIRSEVDDANPCQRELLSRVDRQIGNLRDARLRSGDFEPPDFGIDPREEVEERIPCVEEFPDISERVQEFEQSVVEEDFRDRPQERLQKLQEGRDIISLINQTDGARKECQEQFLQRVTSAIDRVEEEETQLRVLRDRVDEVSEERMQQVENIRRQIDDLVAESGQIRIPRPGEGNGEEEDSEGEGEENQE